MTCCVSEQSSQRQVFCSKGARRALVARSLDVQRRVLQREQDRILGELGAANEGEDAFRLRVNVPQEEAQAE